MQIQLWMIIPMKRHSCPMMLHQTKVLEITIGSHNNKIVFNIIASPTNPIMIRLSWLIFQNAQMYYHTQGLHLEGTKCKKLKFYASHKHNVLNIAIVWIHLKMNMLMNKHKTPSTRKVLVLYINHNVIRFYLLEQGFSSLWWGKETNILYMFFQHNTLWHDNTWRPLLNTKTTKTFWKEKC